MSDKSRQRHYACVFHIKCWNAIKIFASVNTDGELLRMIKGFNRLIWKSLSFAICTANVGGRDVFAFQLYMIGSLIAMISFLTIFFLPCSLSIGHNCVLYFIFFVSWAAVAVSVLLVLFFSPFSMHSLYLSLSLYVWTAAQNLLV